MVTLSKLRYVLLFWVFIFSVIACSTEPLNQKTFPDLLSLQEASESLGVVLSKREVFDKSKADDAIKHHVFAGVYGMENQYIALYLDDQEDSPLGLYIFQFFTDRHARETLNDFVLSENLKITNSKIGDRSYYGVLSGEGLSGFIEPPSVVTFLNGRLVVAVELEMTGDHINRTVHLELAEAISEKL